MLSPVWKLVTAYAISSAGSTMYRLAVPLAIYSATKSPILMSVAYAASVLPVVILSLLGGVVADRANRKRLLVLGDAASAAIAVALAASVAFGAGAYVMIALVFLLATINAVYEPAFFGAVPALSEKAQISHVNAIMRVVDGVFQALGPVLGGVIFLLTSPSLVFLLDGASFVLSTLIIWAISDDRLSATPGKFRGRNVVRDVKDGVSLIWRTPFLRYGLRLFIFTNFSFHMFFGSLVFYLSDTLKMTPGITGAILSIGGLGAAAASMLAPSLAKIMPSGTVICLSTVCAGIMMMLFPISVNPLTVGILLAIILASGSINTVLFISKTQQIVESEYLGRVGATNRLVGVSLVPIAALVGGVATAAVGFSAVTAICGIMRLAVGLLSFLTPSFRSSDGEQVRGLPQAE